MRYLLPLIVLGLIVFQGSAFAKNNPADIQVTEAWVRATYPGQQVGAAYLKIKSDKDASLTKIESPAAKRAEIHTMQMKEGVMLMRELDSFSLPAGQTVQFSQGGHHIMLMNLKQALKAGEKIPLKLSVKRGGEIITLDVLADVRKK